MFCWLIPYLVAYSAGDERLPCGPVHLFQANVAQVTNDTWQNITFNTNVYLEFNCKTVDNATMRCVVDSASIEQEGSNVPPPKGHPGYELFRKDTSIEFSIGFNSEGVYRSWFPTTKSEYVRDTLRAVIWTMHAGLDLARKTFDTYDKTEESVIGFCPTHFRLTKKILAESELEREKILQGYQFHVPYLGDTSDEETIVIKKTRRVGRCAKSTPYIFRGFSSDRSFPFEKKPLKTAIRMIESESEIRVGKKSFSAQTTNRAEELLKTRNKSQRSELITSEVIRVALVDIQSEERSAESSEESSEESTESPERAGDEPRRRA